MSVSAKNTLQEYYQQRRLPLPTYTHVQHADGCWESTVQLSDVYYIGRGKTKREADQNAAQQAIAALMMKPAQTPAIEIDFTNTIVLIDLENAPQWTVRNVSITGGGHIEAFVGAFSSMASETANLAEMYPFATRIHIIRSGHRDAVDHAISVRAGELLHLHHKYIIVSRDRFAAALCDILPNAQYVTSIDKCFYSS
jgi:hypothetical protein